LCYGVADRVGPLHVPACRVHNVQTMLKENPVMKRNISLLLCCVALFALCGCVKSGVRTGPASIYGAESFRPEQLVAQMDSFTVWLCVDRARQTAVLFMPRDSGWQPEFRQGGWRKVDDPAVISDAVLLMRHYYAIGSFADGIGIDEGGQRLFAGYLFAPVKPDMWRSAQDDRTLIIRRLTWDQVVRAGKVPGVPYPDRL